MKQLFILVVSSVLILSILMLSACGRITNNSNSQNNVIESEISSKSDITVPEATSTLAGYFLIMASQFSWGEDTPNIVYGKIDKSDEFGNVILEEYPQTIGMEYVILFDKSGNAETLFCRQPMKDQESMASSGTVKHIEDIGVHTWDELLDYYKIKYN